MTDKGDGFMKIIPEGVQDAMENLNAPTKRWLADRLEWMGNNPLSGDEEAELFRGLAKEIRARADHTEQGAGDNE